MTAKIIKKKISALIYILIIPKVYFPFSSIHYKSTCFHLQKTPMILHRSSVRNYLLVKLLLLRLKFCHKIHYKHQNIRLLLDILK